MQCKSLWIKASAKCINVNVKLLYWLLKLFHSLQMLKEEILKFKNEAY